jgi:hypothetical protein
MRIKLFLVLLVAGFQIAGATTNAPVRTLGLCKTYNDTAKIFDTNCNTAQLTNGVGVFLRTTIDNCRAAAEKRGKSSSSIGSMGGRWLEWATLIALKETKLTPAYWQAEFVAVPKNYNDVLLWSKEYGPVILSCKTSLRERYKQADLEAVALRQHYPNAKFFLITLDEDKQHLATTRKKIASKELLALQAIYDETNMDALFAFLKKLTLTAAPDKVLHSGEMVK